MGIWRRDLLVGLGTTTWVLADVNLSERNLALAALGVKLSIDDYGRWQGHSSSI